MLKQEKQSEEEYNVREKTRVFVADYNTVFNTIWCFTVALSQNIFFANYRIKESKLNGFDSRFLGLCIEFGKNTCKLNATLNQIYFKLLLRIKDEAFERLR